MARRLIPARQPLVLGLVCCVGFAAIGIAFGGGPAPHGVAQASPPVARLAEPVIPFEDQPLADRIDTLIAAAELGEDTQLGISIVDLADGTVIYTRNPEVALNPASNAKLLTTAAALSLLGPEHRYTTKIWTDEDGFKDGVVTGKLYLQGGGDPALVTGNFYELAGQLRAAGVEQIRGPIVVDATRFDADGLPPGFDQKDEFASHRAPTGAMSVNYNTYEVHARPAKLVGEPPTLLVEPPIPSIELVSEAKTVAGNRNKLWVETEQLDGKTLVKFKGEVGIDNGPSSYRYPHTDPSRYAGELLAVALAQRGIKVGKADIQLGEVPRKAERLASLESESLSELCRAINKWSNNFIAEQVLRTLAPGKRATAAAALELVRGYAREIGLPQDGLVIGNGSGLYANNMISPAAITQLLAHVYADFRIRPDFIASLAIMGADGTTRSRLTETPAAGWLRVKTGTLDDVIALSGYAGATGRDPIAFSIVANKLERKHRAKARELLDAIAEQLAIEAQGLEPQPLEKR